MTSRRAIILIIVVAVVCAGLVGFNYARSAMIASFLANMQRPAVAVSAVAAETITWKPGIEAVGTAKAGSGADIAIEASGVVRSVAFTANQRVQSGQLLVQVDDAVERADKQSAEAQIKLTQADIDRIAPLVRRGASSQATLDNAIAALDTARATLARSTAISEQKAIQAPFGGVVGVPRVVVGQYVPVGTIVVTLQDIDRILVDFTVPEQSAGLLAVGRNARFGFTADLLEFSGRVTGFDPKVDPQTRLINAQATIDAPVGRILPGQFLRVRVDLPEEQGIVSVPETALMPSLYGDYVFQVSEAERKEGEDASQPATLVARQVFVKSGRRDNGLVEIIEGIKAGDMVVSAGQNRLQNGASVTIADNAVPGMKAKGEAR
jgi:membrane fusion protein (multidrug efflux system)